MKKTIAVFLASVFFLLIPRFSVANAEAGKASQEIMHAYREARLISLAAATCAGTYVPHGEAPEYSYLGEYGFRIHPYSVDDGKQQVNFMLAYNDGIVEDKKIYVLAFRGSASKQDWEVNLKTSKVAFGGTNPQEFLQAAQETEDSSVPAVHKGFNEYVNAALSLHLDLDGNGEADDLLGTLKKDPDVVLLLTGHSLGGAAATLFAQRLVSLGVPKEQVPVITFGAPAIGNAAFADSYGDRIDLLRIKTKYDFIPGSLQTIFGGFKQFGREKVFDLSGRFADYQHPVSYYFDFAVKNYYDARDKAIEEGLLAALPMEKETHRVPRVAVLVGATQNIQYRPYTPDIKRFILDEYRSFLPSYVILDKNADLYSSDKYDLVEILKEAAEVGAEYVLFLEIGSRQLAQEDRWYIVMNQAVFKVDGSLVTITSQGRRVTYEQGVMQCTISNLEQAREELRGKFSWIETRNSKDKVSQ